LGLREYIAKRAINSVILFLAILVFNFFLFRIPTFFFGVDPADLYVQVGMEAEDIEALRRAWGIPQPDAGFAEWFDHFLKYLGNMVTLNFGFSFKSFRPVAMEIALRLPNTLILLGTSSMLMVLLGLVMGILAASKHGTRTDSSLITVALSLYSLPIFWLGILALIIFGFYLGLVPLTGGTISYPPPQDPLAYLVDYLHHLILPAGVLTLGGFGSYMLLMRNSLIDVLTEDFIVTAKAKGLDNRTILYRHALKNAILPMITLVAMNFAFIVSGAVLTETVFSWYGMGRYLFESLFAQDWPSSQAIFFIIGLCVIIANFIADLLYAVLDPRIRYG
jgi:peptide/nickel transport system permease protein